MIYFDNAATSFPKPPQVAAAVPEAIACFGNPSRSAHPPALAAARCIEQARQQAAELFGCSDPARVAFTKNVTEALNLAIASLDSHIVSNEAEHNAILRPLHRRGNYSLAAVDAHGRYSADRIAELIRPDTCAVVIGHASNLTGLLAPVAEIGRLRQEHGIALVIDAAQTAGLAAIDMEAMRIDALCFTGHKSLYGLQGTGGICLSKRFAPRPLLVGGSGSQTFDPEQPKNLPGLLEAGTLNAHGIAGLAAGIAYVKELGVENIRQRAGALAQRFLVGVRTIPGIRFYGDYETENRLPIVALNLGQADSAEVAAVLADEYDIAVRAGAHCAPLLHKRFGTEKQGAVRFSFSHHNSAEEIDLAVSALRAIASEFS